VMREQGPIRQSSLRNRGETGREFWLLFADFKKNWLKGQKAGSRGDIASLRTTTKKEIWPRMNTDQHGQNWQCLYPRFTCVDP